jgi:hypothetical protein
MEGIVLVFSVTCYSAELYAIFATKLMTEEPNCSQLGATVLAARGKMFENLS